jgi:hypothetical protein
MESLPEENSKIASRKIITLFVESISWPFRNFFKEKKSSVCVYLIAEARLD